MDDIIYYKFEHDDDNFWLSPHLHKYKIDAYSTGFRYDMKNLDTGKMRIASQENLNNEYATNPIDAANKFSEELKWRIEQHLDELNCLFNMPIAAMKTAREEVTILNMKEPTGKLI